MHLSGQGCHVREINSWPREALQLREGDDIGPCHEPTCQRRSTSSAWSIESLERALSGPVAMYTRVHVKYLL